MPDTEELPGARYHVIYVPDDGALTHNIYDSKEAAVAACSALPYGAEMIIIRGGVKCGLVMDISEVTCSGSPPVDPVS